MARDWKVWLAKHKLYIVLGLAGVSEHEPRRARRLGNFFTFLAILAAMGLLLQWQLDLLGEVDSPAEYYLNWGVWLFFVLQYVSCSLLVKDKQRYMRQNWLLPIVIGLGTLFLMQTPFIAPFLRGFRPLLAVVLLLPAISMLARFFMDGQLRTTLLAAAIIVLIFGFVVAAVDPNIKSAWDGVWWAVATVSTVGYGDVVPTSALGRLLGAGLVIMGLGIFVVITANFLALVLRRDKKETYEEVHKINEMFFEVHEISERQQEMYQLLKEMTQRLDAVEAAKNRSNDT